jgi:hypothetical protein
MYLTKAGSKSFTSGEFVYKGNVPDVVTPERDILGFFVAIFLLYHLVNYK